jgi:hypothetical protein
MNAAVVQARSDSRQATRPGSWRLSNRLRKTVLLLHIVAGGAWFGLDVAMAVLVVTAIGTDSAAVRAYTLQSLKLITVWPAVGAHPPPRLDNLGRLKCLSRPMSFWAEDRPFLESRP